MLVSGMLFSCTNSTESGEQQAADSTAQVNQSSVIILEESEEIEAEEAEVDSVEEEMIETEVNN